MQDRKVVGTRGHRQSGTVLSWAHLTPGPRLPGLAVGFCCSLTGSPSAVLLLP